MEDFRTQAIEDAVHSGGSERGLIYALLYVGDQISRLATQRHQPTFVKIPKADEDPSPEYEAYLRRYS